MTLLYKGSKDGYTADDFLQKCNNKNKLLVLIRSWEHDKVFGGYIDITIDNKCKNAGYIPD